MPYRAATPDWGHSRVTLTVSGRHVRVHLTPPGLLPGTAAVVHVPRPSLGRLQLDDGELVELDQELLIGRNPDRDREPSAR